MKAGALSHRVTIQYQVRAENAIGEDEITWTTLATVWMKIIPKSGAVYYSAHQDDSTVSGYFSIRHRSDIEPTMRIKFGDRYLYIVAVWSPDEKNVELMGTYSEALD